RPLISLAPPLLQPPCPPRPPTLSLHDALPISRAANHRRRNLFALRTRKSPRTSRPISSQWPVLGLGQTQRRMGPRPFPLSFNQRSEEHTSELQSRFDLVCRLLLEKKNKRPTTP